MMPMVLCKFRFLLIWVVIIMMPLPTFGQNNPNESSDNNDTGYSCQSFLQGIEGIWISDVYSTTSYSGLPFYILDIHNGIAKLDMIGYGYAETLASNSFSNISKEERATAQWIEENDSILYIAWSNERLKVPNQAIASVLGQTGGDVVHEITNKEQVNCLETHFLENLVLTL